MSAYYKGKTYSLTSSQAKQIANLCVQENGNAGVRDEASQMLNQYEMNGTGKYDHPYNFIRFSKWYSRSEHWMDYGSSSATAVETVRDVFENGNRSLPKIIDEHDAIEDVKWAKHKDTGEYINTRDRSAYKKDITIIHNVYGSEYTFFKLIGEKGYEDVCGYTKEAYEKYGGKDVTPEASVSPLSIKIAKKGDKGENVRMIQTMLKALGFMTGNIDGNYGDQTEHAVKVFQSVHGLSQDGKVTLNTKRKLIADYKKVLGLGIAEKREAALRGKYTVTASSLNLRDGAGTSGNIITAMKNGSIVTTKGYYTDIDGVKWYYVMFTDSDGKNYCGFASSQYLNKIG